MEKKVDKILVEMKSLREDMTAGFEQVDKRFEQVDKRFEQVDKRFEQVDKRFAEVDRRFVKVEKELGETYKLAQRANVLYEKLNSDLQQVAEGVIEVRMIARKLDNHEDRITDLEWRHDMHEKAIKKVMNG